MKTTALAVVVGVVGLVLQCADWAKCRLHDNEGKQHTDQLQYKSFGVNLYAIAVESVSSIGIRKHKCIAWQTLRVTPKPSKAANGLRSVELVSSGCAQSNAGKV